MPKPIPDGYHSVTPYLVVQGASRLIEFMQTVLGGRQVERLDTPGGTIAHAEVRIGDSVVMLADEQEMWKAQPAMLHVYVDDVDATYRRALDAGATKIREPADQFYGDRVATVRDFAGNVWSIARHVEDVSRDEVDRRYAEMMQKGGRDQAAS